MQAVTLSRARRWRYDGVNRAIWTLLLVVVSLWLLIAATPAISRLTGALVPLVLVAGIVGAIWRIVWTATRRW